MSNPDRNPLSQEMADESMVRNLAAQAIAIWPQEQDLVRRYPMPAAPRILDVACGTGEATWRLAELFADGTLLGVDIDEGHLARARESSARFGDRVRFQRDDAFALSVPDAAFDLVVCRHFLQSVPDVDRPLRELCRALAPGGTLHIIGEDYGMVHLHPTRLDTDAFWSEGPIVLGSKVGTDMRIGRKLFGMLAGLDLTELRIDYIVVDTLRVPREVFAGIFTAWRDGFSAAIATHSRFSLDEVRAHWEDMLACLRDPQGYAVWQIPVISARKPAIPTP